MTQEEVVNMFCNVTNANLNAIQRGALERLIRGTYDTGVKDGKEDLEPIFQCGHCGTEALDLRVKVLTYFDDKEDLYCKHCIAKAESINGKRCDGCSSAGLALKPVTLKSGDGMYCVYCLKVNGEHDERD